MGVKEAISGRNRVTERLSPEGMGRAIRFNGRKSVSVRKYPQG